MDDQVDQPLPVALRFDIRTLLWVMAVIASSMATFPSGGLAIAGLVFLLWWLLFCIKRVWIPSGHWWLWVLLGGVVVLLLPFIQGVRENVSYSHYPCSTHLRFLSFSLIQHNAYRGALPAVALPGSSQTLSHSWRVAILPYWDGESLHDCLRLDEPWDSQANKPHTTTPVYVFECRGTAEDYPGMTGHHAVVDPKALFRPGKPRSLSEEDVPDGLENTLMLIHAPQMVPWAKPENLTFDEAVALLASPIDSGAEGVFVIDPGFFYESVAVRYVAWADGRVTGLASPVPERVARAILTADGGDEFDIGELGIYTKPRLDYGRCVSLTLFVLTSLAPLPRLIGRWRAERQRAGASPW